MKKVFSILIALALVLCFSLVAAVPVMAQSWLTGWSYRVEITIDSDKIDGALVDFPVLVYLSTSSGIDPDDVSFVFDELGAEKLKLAVTTDDGTTQCYVEIEKWDDANEQAWLWVKVPSISSSANTTLYLYYDSTQPDNTTWVGETGTTPAQNVWDNNFVGVWHKHDDSPSSVKDSTSNANDGTKKAANEPTEANGKIGRAQSYDGSDDFINVDDDNSLNIQSVMTISGWVRNNAQVGQYYIAKYDLTNGYYLGMTGIAPAGRVFGGSTTGGTIRRRFSSTQLAMATWYHVAFVWDGSTYNIYVGGSLDNGNLEGTPGNPPSTTGIDFTMGSAEGGQTPFGGLIDEVRISNVVRSAAWIKATYHSGDDNLLSYGSQETPPPLQVYGLIIRSTEGGRVTKPGQGHYVYDPGTKVKLVATPDDGYRFVGWTGDVRRIDDVDAASTTIWMDYGYAIKANFEVEETSTVETEVQYELTVSSTMGGSVTSPGEGTFPYIEGNVVSLVAKPANGYKFVNWTGDSITNVDSTTTTVTMNGDYSVKANFEFEQTTTTDFTEGSSGPLACFIATTAYGTPTAEQIDVLREFRDVVLLESAVGSQFVALYYQLSPPIADFIAGNELLRTLVRELLVDPVVWVVEATGAIWQN